MVLGGNCRLEKNPKGSSTDETAICRGTLGSSSYPRIGLRSMFRISKYSEEVFFSFLTFMRG
jgi:hypothetical protein